MSLPALPLGRGTTPGLSVLLDDGTGTFPTDISPRVMALNGYEISRGRSDWQGAVTAGEMSVTLNNSDGFFTVGAGAVFVDQKVRLTETVNGVAYTRFTGYVKAWPTSWPAVVATFSTVQPTATDAQARAERTTLRSMLEEEILAANPTAYYTLGEAEGSTVAGDTSGNQVLPLTITGTGTAPTFGTGTGPTDGLSAATFTATGGWLTADGQAPITSPTTYGIGAWIATSSSPAYGFIAGSNGWNLAMAATGHIQGGPAGLLTSLDSGVSLADGRVHFVAVGSNDGVTATMYVDGVAVNTMAMATNTIGYPQLTVGGQGKLENSPGVPASFYGTISHVFTKSSLSAADVATIYAAAVGSESGTARITRLAGYASISVGTMDTSLTNVGPQATSGASAFAAIQDVADAEGGLVFINGSGNLTFHNRSRPSVKTAPDLTLSSQWVTPEIQPVLDDQQLINYFEATAVGTGSTQLAVDTASQTSHGRYPESKTFLVLTDPEALDRANWAVTKLATPVPRYGTLTINLFGMPASQASTVLAALDLNCWLRVTSMASQTPGGATADVVVEGWQEQVTADSWSITCNVVAHSLFVALILDDPTFGALDAYPLGY